MNILLNADNNGIPLTVIEKHNYENWLNKQTPQSQTWLANIDFTGNDLALVPNADGTLNQAIFVVKDARNYFACGDLITKLPAGQYLLQAENENKQAICFAWLIGAYKFDRYLNKDSNRALASLAVNDQTLVDDAIKYAEATALVRDLVNTPAADMMPED
jgi:leucyl aminopeptidase